MKQITINTNGQTTTLESNGNKRYISSRNSHNGKGKCYEIFTDSKGNEYVKFWSKQVAILTGTMNGCMGHCFDIVK